MSRSAIPRHKSRPNLTYSRAEPAACRRRDHSPGPPSPRAAARRFLQVPAQHWS